jgi:hypothetical protein
MRYTNYFFFAIPHIYEKRCKQVTSVAPVADIGFGPPSALPARAKHGSALPRRYFPLSVATLSFAPPYPYAVYGNIV